MSVPRELADFLFDLRNRLRHERVVVLILSSIIWERSYVVTKHHQNVNSVKLTFTSKTLKVY